MTMKIIHIFQLIVIGASLPLSRAYSAALLKEQTKKNHLKIFSQTIHMRQLLKDMKKTVPVADTETNDDAQEDLTGNGQDRHLMEAKVATMDVAEPAMNEVSTLENKSRKGRKLPRGARNERNLGKGKGSKTDSPTSSPTTTPPSNRPSSSPSSSQSPSASPTVSEAPTAEFSLDNSIEFFEDKLLPVFIDTIDEALTGGDLNSNDVFALVNAFAASFRKVIERIAGKVVDLVVDLQSSYGTAFDCFASDEAFLDCGATIFSIFIEELFEAVNELPELISNAVTTIGETVSEQAQNVIDTLIDELGGLINGLPDEIAALIPGGGGGGCLDPTGITCRRHLLSFSFIGDGFEGFTDLVDNAIDAFLGFFTLLGTVLDYVEGLIDDGREFAGFRPPPVIVENDGSIAIEGKYKVYDVQELLGPFTNDIIREGATLVVNFANKVCQILPDFVITVSIPIQQICEIIGGIAELIILEIQGIVEIVYSISRFVSALLDGHNEELDRQFGAWEYAIAVGEKDEEGLGMAIAVKEAFKSIGIRAELREDE